MKHLPLILILFISPLNVFAQFSSTNEWHISPCLKYDAFYFMNAISKVDFYNRMYPRDREIWQGRLGTATITTINTIVDSVGGGFKPCYLFTYVPAFSLDDLIHAFQDTANLRERILTSVLMNKDPRYEASINDLNRILPLSALFISVFQKMKDAGWENDWKAIRCRLNADIHRKKVEFAKYSPAFLKAQVAQFLGMDVQKKDSSSTVYYVYYAFPNAFKLPYNMMATWNIEEPTYFFSGYLHEMLHLFSIYQSELVELHNGLVRNSAELSRDREVLTKQLYESDDEFYILAAEAYLSVKLGIRTHQEAVDYLKSADGGTVVYSLLIYNYLQKSFDNQRHSFGSFLKNVFFKTVNAKGVDKFLADTK